MALPIAARILAIGLVASAALPALAQTAPPPPPPPPAAAPPRTMEDEVLDFVRRFYGWYTARALAGPAPGVELALRERRYMFEEPLARALQHDLVASAANRHEVVGLDWDPFLNTQDPADRYEVTDILRRGNAYRVTLEAITASPSSRAPAVIAEVVWQLDHWCFSNFFDPNDRTYDLLATLRRLEADRKGGHGRHR